MNDSPATPSRPEKRLRRALEYAGARLLVSALSVLPLGLAAWAGRRLGDFLRLVDRRHRERAREQAVERLGLDASAAPRFVRENFRHYGMVLAEFARLGRMHKSDFERYVDPAGFPEYAGRLLSEGKGLLFITGHFGNWEWSNSLSTSLGFSGGSIARPLDNERLNEYVRGIRERNGMRIFDKRGAIRKALATLKNNEVVGVLIDQDAGPAGLMSPFLGKPASTITIPVELATRTGSPMVVVVLRRGGSSGKRFTLRYTTTPLRADSKAPPEAEVRRLVDALNADLGSLILEAPEQWFWIHRRWKSEGKR